MDIAFPAYQESKNNERPLKPTVALLSKLGSIVVHADELAHPVKGHVFDHFALKQLVEDPEVREWLKSMGAFVPVKRT